MDGPRAVGDPGRAAPPSAGSEPRVFLWTLVTLLAFYLALRFGLPRAGVWMGVSEVPAPIPVFALWIYMLCATVGALVWASSDDRRWRLFLGAPVRLLVGGPHVDRRVRTGVLVAVPLLAGWAVWQRVMPSTDVPTVVRLQHPTQPEEYAPLENPVRALSDDAREAAEREGLVLYQTNCRPCHGTTGGGDGPLARGLRLQPIDFADAGTIASVIESYPFWRIRTGHAALPDIATPWNSAMPSWETELSDDEIWRIILAEYALSGTEPRVPERLDR
ncbi:MAG: cytochrome c [Gemmatimonadota bacterium]|nr:cytochrome c [Gemmatimonadota bacterium]